MINFKQIIDQIKYKDWTFVLGLDGTRHYLQVEFNGRCVVSGKSEVQRGRKWLLSPHMTTSEVVATAFKAVMTAEEHEVRENFQYKEAPVFCPHYDVELLAFLHKQSGSLLDVREA